uniref:Sperm microtubule associated protein 2 n=1 Tax=Microcebus murinus TaxID=30608 RepID=A0A8C5VXP8_MICMU
KVRKRKRLSELAKPKTNWQVVKDRCPRCPGLHRRRSPVNGSSGCHSPGSQPPCWKSGTLCQSPGHTPQTTTVSSTWPRPKSSRTSAFLTEILMPPRRRWPVPGSSRWLSPKCARSSTRATTPSRSP